MYVYNHFCYIFSYNINMYKIKQKKMYGYLHGKGRGMEWSHLWGVWGGVE